MPESHEIHPPQLDTSRIVLPQTYEPLTMWPDLDTFLETWTLRDGLHTVLIGGVPLQVLLEKQTSANDLLVMFHGAGVKSKLRIPYFSGRNMTQGMNAHRLFISDPSLILDSELLLAWYAGNQHQNLQLAISQLINKVSDYLGAKKSILFGPSGGGFASLYYGTQVKNSISVAVNPQTKISKYDSKVQRQYTSTCFGATDELNHRRILDNFIDQDLVDLYKQRQSNTVVYIQNATDGHLHNHALPFFEHLHPSNAVYLNMGNWGQGHVPPSAHFLKSVISTYCQPDWLITLETANYKKRPSPDEIEFWRTQLVSN